MRRTDLDLDHSRNVTEFRFRYLQPKQSPNGFDTVGDYLPSVCFGRVTIQRGQWKGAVFIRDNRRLPEFQGLHRPLQLGAKDFRELRKNKNIKVGLTSAAAHILCHDSTEVPEARLTAVALLSPNTRLTGALAGGWITRALIGAVDVTLAGA